MLSELLAFLRTSFHAPTAPTILPNGALGHRATHQFQRYHAFENVHPPLLIFELLLVDKNGGGQLSGFHLLPAGRGQRPELHPLVTISF